MLSTPLITIIALLYTCFRLNSSFLNLSMRISRVRSTKGIGDFQVPYSRNGIHTAEFGIKTLFVLDGKG